jgi:hypothetical protein
MRPSMSCIARHFREPIPDCRMFEAIRANVQFSFQGPRETLCLRRLGDASLAPPHPLSNSFFRVWSSLKTRGLVPRTFPLRHVCHSTSSFHRVKSPWTRHPGTTDNHSGKSPEPPPPRQRSLPSASGTLPSPAPKSRRFLRPPSCLIVHIPLPARLPHQRHLRP